jgi:NAD(P)-dependent dehydrogenase (short-subunit alcohol dehydrogenase family)
MVSTTTSRPGRPVAIVTGARRGIGAAIAVELARSSFDVAITDVSDDGANATLEAIAQAGVRSLFVKSDLAETEDHARVIGTVADWGGAIHCLINNAGMAAVSRGDLLDMQASAFDRVLDTNLRGTFFFAQAVAREMLAMPDSRPRSIIVISSISAELASIERGEYCISKAGLGMVTKLLALRLASEQIAVFEIRPGIIRTPMTTAVAQKYEARIGEGLVPMGRWGAPDDVASVVAQLASGKFGFATGSVINVDGGLAVPRL